MILLRNSTEGISGMSLASMWICTDSQELCPRKARVSQQVIGQQQRMHGRGQMPPKMIVCLSPLQISSQEWPQGYTYKECQALNWKLVSDKLLFFYCFLFISLATRGWINSQNSV